MSERVDRKKRSLSVRSFGPEGWKTYTESYLLTANVSMLEEDAIWSFIYGRIRDPATQKVQVGRIDVENLDTWLAFKKVFKSARPMGLLKKHFEMVMVPNLHKARMPGEAILEFYYALRIPIDKEFLNNIRTEVVLRLDKMGRIIFVNQYGEGGFELGGGGREETRNKKIGCQDKDLWIFLLKKVHDDRTGKLTVGRVRLGATAVWEEFIASHNVPTTAANLMHRFLTFLAPNLHMAPLDFHSVLTLYFALEIPVEKSFLEKLRKIAVVTLDENGVITACFAKKDGGIALSRPISATKTTDQWTTSQSSRPAFTEEEELRMWVYMYGRIRDARTHIIRKNYEICNDPQVWECFVGADGTALKPPMEYFTHFTNRMIPNLHRARLEKQTKVALYYGLQIPVNAQYLKELKEEAIIEMAPNGCIHTYRKREKRPSTTENNVKSVDVIDIDADEPPPEKKVRIKSLESSKDVHEESDIWMNLLKGLRSNLDKELALDPDTFLKLLLPNLHNANLDDEIKLELYQHLNTPVNPHFLKKVGETFNVEVDEEGKILSYGKDPNETKDVRELLESILQKITKMKT